MPVPVIATPTSVLGFLRGEAWEYIPTATENPTRWLASRLPTGVAMDVPTKFAATGDNASDVLTATGHDFANDNLVVFQALTGPTELAIDVIYAVRDLSGATFKLAAFAGAAAIDFTGDLTAGSISKLPTGRIAGPATIAGVTNVSLYASNASGTSLPLVFPIGIEPAPASFAGIGLLVDALTGIVTVSGAPLDGGALFSAKEDDDILLFIQFTRGKNVVDLGTIATLTIALKERETEGRILIGGGANGSGSPVVLHTTGTGTDRVYIAWLSISGDAVAGALSDAEDDAGTLFSALAEIRWTEANSSGAGPNPLTRTSRTFPVQIVRDLTS